MSAMEDFSSHIGSLGEEDLVYLDCYLDSVYNDSPDFKDLGNIWSPLSEELNDCPSETLLDISEDLVPSLQPSQSTLSNNEDHEDASLQNVQPVRKNRGIPSERFVSYKTLPSSRAKSYPCEFCGVKLSSKESCKRHILSKHTKERRHVCNVCDKTFLFKFSLNAHRAIHEETPRHVCICGASFKLRTSYMSHVQRIHQAASEIKFSCELCSKSFRDRHTLRLHMTSVHEPKTIPCKANGCKKVFSSISLMRCHYRYHLNRKFTCDKCGQSFSTESYLQKHILSHSGIRPYSCLDCGKTFLSASHRNQHRRICHSSVKMYQCSICGKQFKTKDLLNYHESNHRGEKPFKCEVCGYATAYRNTYYVHRKRHRNAKSSKEGTESESIVDLVNCGRGMKKNGTSEIKNKGRKTIQAKPKLSSIENHQIPSSSSTHEQLPSLRSCRVLVISPVSSSSSPNPMPISKQVNTNLIILPRAVINDSCKRDNELDLCDTSPLSMKCTDSDGNFGGDGFVKGSSNLSLKEVTSRQNISATEKNDCFLVLSNNGRCSISECRSADEYLSLIKIGDNSFAGVCANHSVSGDSEITELNLSSVENLTLTAVDLKCLGSDLTADNILTTGLPTNVNRTQNVFTVLSEEKQLEALPSETDLLNINSVDQSETLITESDQVMNQCGNLKTGSDHTDMSHDVLLPLSHLEDINIKSSEVHSDVNVDTPAEIDVSMPSLSNHIDDSFHLAHMEVVCRLCDEQFFCMDTYITHLECIHK